jgi:hypothetical protein
MANTEQKEGGSVLLGLYQFLPPLHPGILRNYKIHDKAMLAVI